MKPCVIVMAINSTTKKALQTSSTSEHLSAWKSGFFAFVLKLCEALCRQTLPSECLGLCKHLLPSCLLPEMIHSCLWTVHALTLMSNSWSSDSCGFCFCFHFPSPSPSLFLFSIGLSFCISCSWLCSTLFCTSRSFFFYSSLSQLCCPSSFFTVFF